MLLTMVATYNVKITDIGKTKNKMAFVMSCWTIVSSVIVMLGPKVEEDTRIIIIIII